MASLSGNRVGSLVVVAMIIGMLRVKNEARWIREVIDSIQPVCGGAIVFDDHSEDATPDICEEMGCEVIRSPFSGLNEVRDKNCLLDAVITSKAQWALCIDGDEILDAGSHQTVADATLGKATAYSMRIKYLWDRRDQVRVDGIYGRFRRGSMFRVSEAVAYQDKGNGGGFHCGNVPLCKSGSIEHLNADILHLGYMERDDRIRKFAWYNRNDPNNNTEDCYRHMVIGDLPEFPASYHGKWAGPLELKAWP